jgi:hypothetical protein
MKLADKPMLRTPTMTIFCLRLIRSLGLLVIRGVLDIIMGLRPRAFAAEAMIPTETVANMGKTVAAALSPLVAARLKIHRRNRNRRPLNHIGRLTSVIL